MKPVDRARVLASIACGLEASVAVYAAMRVFEVALLAQPNPATLIASAHAGYFWRAWTSTYLGGFFALTVALLARRPDRIATAALRALPWTALFAVTQALFVP